MKLSTSLLCAILICLSACGFTLRGTTKLPPLLDTVLIEPYGPYDPLHLAIKEQLTLAHATVTTSVKDSTIKLLLKNENVSRQTTVIGTDGEIKQQLLIYAFDYQVKSKDGKTLIPLRTIRSTRVLYIQPGQILSQDNEERELTHIMREEAVQQLIRQLAAINKQTPAPKPILPAIE